jgi:hypothetical protein
MATVFKVREMLAASRRLIVLLLDYSNLLDLVLQARIIYTFGLVYSNSMFEHPLGERWMAPNTVSSEFRNPGIPVLKSLCAGNHADQKSIVGKV